MGYLEHEDIAQCGCPTCDLTDLYIQEYEDYKIRKPYKTIDVNSIPGDLETVLNKVQAEGYELQAVTRNNVLIMRSVPPMPPTAREVLAELYKRQEKAGGTPGGADDIGPTMGGMQ